MTSVDDNNKIEGTENIANYFNKYFCTVGERLDKYIKNSNKSNGRKSVNRKTPTNENEVKENYI